MSGTSRRHSQEMEFGSDSFMDVVANVVGILIILIVLAGIKVGKYVQEQVNQEQVKHEQAVTAPVIAQVTPEHLNIPTTVPERLMVPQPARLVREPIADDATAMPFLPEVELKAPAITGTFPDPQLPEQEAKKQTLFHKLGVLKAEAEARKKIFPTLQQKYAQLDQAQTEIAALLADQQAMSTNMLEDSQAKEKNLQALARQVDDYVKQAELVTNDINQLSKEILDHESKKPLPKTLEHKITPVARIVEGDEIHFRIKNNRIAYMPINELTEDLKRRVVKNRQTLMQTHNLTGTVGPINGFSMKYSVSLQEAPVADQLRSGGGLVRIGVDGWEIMPEKEVQGETEAQAFKQGSNFDSYIANSGQKTTLTLWVYTDSFSLARKVQAHAQQMGYRVAARPLPEGVPIIGSPNGSKSFSQ